MSSEENFQPLGFAYLVFIRQLERFLARTVNPKSPLNPEPLNP